MKKVYIILVVFLFMSSVNAQNVGIGTKSPSVSAKLEVSSTSQGFLPPRLTISQRDSIVSPIEGLEIWNSDCKELQVYNGTTWTNMTGGAACFGYIPPTIIICTQVWRVKNLDVRTYRNGEVIPQVTDAAQWSSLTTGAWCWYNNDSATYASVYGKLYNWYAVNDSRGLAPQGFHVASDSEWTVLSTCLGGDAVAGGAMKENGITHWTSPNLGATNISGFSGRPGGFRNNAGTFNYIGMFASFWCSTENDTNNSWERSLYYNDGHLGTIYNDKSYGFSVRCVKD